MDQFFAALKDYTAIVVACLAAAVSLVNLAWTTRLTEGRERRKVLWEQELARFSELEDVAGRLVEDLLRFNIREDSERASANEKLQYFSVAAGRFLRYERVAGALRNLEYSAGWYIRQDMKHDSADGYKKARSDVSDSFKALISACDETLKNTQKRL